MFSRLAIRVRPVLLAGPAAVALAAAGCGASPSGTIPSAGGTGSGTTGTTTTISASSGATSPSPSPRAVVQSAPNEVKKLLSVGKPGTAIGSQGVLAGWAPANGTAIPADPSHISGFGFVPDKAKRIQILAFAVKDSSGRCAGGELVANAAGTRVTGGRAITVPAKAPCTGDEVAKLAGHG